MTPERIAELRRLARTDTLFESSDALELLDALESAQAKMKEKVSLLLNALHSINLCHFNSMSSRREMVRLAEEAIEETKEFG